MITKNFAGWLRDLDGNTLKNVVPGVAVRHEADPASFGIILEVPFSSYVSVLWSTPDNDWMIWYDHPDDDAYDDYDYDCECKCSCCTSESQHTKDIWRDDNKHVTRDDYRAWSAEKQRLRHSRR